MKIISANIKKGFVKLKIENEEDLWHLSSIIETGDTVKGSTTRKIKVGTEEKSAAYKKTIFIALKTENVEFTAQTLKISGTILEAPEEISRGSHHTLQAEINNIITIEKQKWPSFQIEKLKEASETKMPSIIICIFDREEAFFAQMTRQGHKMLAHIKGEVAKKRAEHTPTGEFYKQIIEKLKEYDQRFKLDTIILASPSFWKEELLKTLGAGVLRNKLLLASCSSADETAFNEVLKREETQQALKQSRASQEQKVIDELLVQISRNALATYGLQQTKEATETGAVKTLLITDKLLQKAREQGKYEELENIMKKADELKGKVIIIHGEYASGKKLDGLGGIAAILRYRI